MVKVKQYSRVKSVRMSFSRIDEVLEMPNLIRSAEKNSYKWFLDEGLKRGFPGHFLHHRLSR
jgi:DNA-directed RNA polymerase subunit beta